MTLKDWFKKQIVGLAMATSNVSNNLTSQRGEELTNGTNKVTEKDADSLMNGLRKGQMNKEVESLRWRTYKVLRAAKGKRLAGDFRGLGEDFEGDISTDMETIDYTKVLAGVQLDKADNYPLEMVATNKNIILGLGDTDFIGDMDLTTHNTYDKMERTIQVERNFIPKFYLENFTNKVNIRRITDEKKLLEFYVSKYPGEQTHGHLFITELKKCKDDITKPTNIFTFDECGFITDSDNVLGSEDFMIYSYNNIKLDKIVEFAGNFVVKFTADVLIDGQDMLSEYVVAELDKKYEEKAPRY